MDALTAAYALSFVNNRNAVFVICDSVYRTAEFAGALEMRYCVVRAGFCALTAFAAFCRVYFGMFFADGDSAEIAGVYTSFAETVLAVIGNDITGNGTVLAGGAYDLNDIAVVDRSGRFVFGKAHALADYLSFLIYAAAELRLWSLDKVEGYVVPFFLKFSGKGKLGDLVQNVVFDFYHVLISKHQKFPP